MPPRALLPPDHRDALPVQPLLPGGAAGLSLRRGRVHEFCGPARRVLAAMAAGGAGGAVLWVLPAWLPERPMPEGMLPFLDPARLILVMARRADDLLWAAEEGLRSGAVGAVVADLTDLPALTPVRRLQLAAEAGRGAITGGGTLPLGLILLPGAGGAAGTESRWHMAPCPGGGWRLDRRRARTDPPAAWTLAPARAGLRATPAALPADAA
jgi:protein ImuA